MVRKVLPANCEDGGGCPDASCKGKLYLCKRFGIYLLECDENPRHYRLAELAEISEFENSQNGLGKLAAGDKCPFKNCAGVLEFSKA